MNKPNSSVSHYYSPSQNSESNGGHNPYEFILNADGKPPKPPTSLASRLLLVVGGIFLLFVIIALALTMFLGKQGPSDKEMLIISEQQTVIDVASSVASTTKSDSLKALALNTQLSLQTDQKNISNLLVESGAKIDQKQIDSAVDSEPTAKLTAAKGSSTYDNMAKTILDDALTDYVAKVKIAYQQSDDPDKKQLLSDAYTNANILLEQSSATKIH